MNKKVIRKWQEMYVDVLTISHSPLIPPLLVLHACSEFPPWSTRAGILHHDLKADPRYPRGGPSHCRREQSSPTYHRACKCGDSWCGRWLKQGCLEIDLSILHYIQFKTACVTRDDNKVCSVRFPCLFRTRQHAMISQSSYERIPTSPI